MTKAASEVLSQALALPDEERAVVAAELLASLEPERGREVEEVWGREIERRILKARAGETSASPWPDVRARVERYLASR